MSINVVTVRAELEHLGAQLIGPKQLAPILNITTRTLQRYRAEGSGPDWSELAGRIYYDPRAVLEWIEDLLAQKQEPAKSKQQDRRRLLIANDWPESKFGSRFLVMPDRRVANFKPGEMVQGVLNAEEVRYVIAMGYAHWEDADAIDVRWAIA
jgi:hypothetical protein